MSESKNKRRRTLLIGVGGTGSNAVDLLYQRIDTLGNQIGNEITAIVFDTDSKDASAIKRATAIPMADPRSLGEVIRSMEPAFLEDWFPIHSRLYDGQEMHKGAAQWRKKSYLAFCNLMNNSAKRGDFEKALERLVDRESSETVYEIYIVASIAGGTGSGSFIPIAMYAKKYLSEKFHIQAQTFAMLACPDIYQDSLTDPDQRIKVYSNAYAILRELNAMNLVATGYNNPKMNKEKHAPVQFRIGHPGNPYVGNLFDSADEAFWGPDAAPFQGIFLLDKVPGLSSVKAHDSIMANSLYTMLCTDIGPAFDSEKSNQAAKLSEKDNASAIYAGVSSAQICYPLQAVVDYIATQKAYDASMGEWTLLHRATEDTIEEESKAAREMRQSYSLKRGEYAGKLLTAVENEQNTPTSDISQLLHRSLIDEAESADGEVTETERVAEYVKMLLKELRRRLAHDSAATIKNRTSGTDDLVQKPKFLASAADREAARTSVRDLAVEYYALLNQYYGNSVKIIRNQARGLADAILPASFDKAPDANALLSMAENVMKKDGKYIHPVAAMVALCKLQKLLLEKLPKGFKVWDSVRSFDEPVLPFELLVAKDEEEKKSRYSALGETRFQILANPEVEPDEYLSKDSDTYLDSTLLQLDAAETLDRLEAEAEKQLYFAVLSAVEERVNVLIEKYRSFFNRFETAREDLQMMAKAAKRVGIATQDDVLNLAASEADKDAAYKEYQSVAGVVSAEAQAAADHVTGSSVFMMAFDGMREQFASEPVEETKDAFSKLFGAMIDAYRQEVMASDFYKKRAGKNVLEVIVDSCGRGTSTEDVFKRVGEAVRAAIEKAKPSLTVEPYGAEGARSCAYEIRAILISAKTAQYLKKNADEFGLKGDDERAAAETFLNKSNITGVILAISKDIPDNVLYVTSKIDCIRPDCISKINELSPNPVYYRQYLRALERMTEQETDMWNPHLGANLYKRGYLPYINTALTAENDQAFAKAFLYALLTAKVTYHPYPRQSKNVFWYNDDGKQKVILVPNARGAMEEVTIQEINKILTWLRVEEDRITEWSRAFDEEVEMQCKNLPTMMALDSQQLSRRITESPIVAAMRDNLMAKVATGASQDDVQGEEGAEPAKAPRGKLNLSLLELAFRIKVLEESDRDCDDAEKILRVGYETLLKFCKAKLGKDDDEALTQIYYHQLEKFILALYNDDDTQRLGDEAYSYVDRIITWANANDCFMNPVIGKAWDKVNLLDFIK